ncbi:SIR2 family protein [Pseudomonas putida]|nr:SIR2 family protein [Pseudomonas putida]HDS0966897.1 SIR2 family protein [Pseudomonas putida]HDS0993348.1 SIR2 family protein [Pseudomonas putida]
MNANNNDWLEQLDRHLASPCLTWLLGAGVSFGAKIPLMYPLTGRVRALAQGTEHMELLDALFNEIPEGAHIEHILSHLGDYSALASRSRLKTVSINSTDFTLDQMSLAHKAILGWIAETIRWGYVPARADANEQVGNATAPLVEIRDHKDFVDALFKTSQAGLHDRRQAVRLFTTNYDTLIEDALALANVTYWDGFSGGAIAFRTHRFGDDEPKNAVRACVVKLHGSIDWHLGDDGKVWRVRDFDTYPNRHGLILIHPQATKYAATQRDPFAAQFDLFRKSLSSREDNVLAICGYSFGDDHINDEIEICMGRVDSRTTLLAFVREVDGLPECLVRWRAKPWSTRLYILTQNGLYVGRSDAIHTPVDNSERAWWTFSGVTKMLRDGSESFL